jgi:hypothetical protein
MTDPTDADRLDRVETVADLVAGSPVERPAVGPADDVVALSVADEDVPVAYDGAGFRADARKTGNLLAHLGVRAGRTVAVADDPYPQPVLSTFAAALLGAVVRVVPLDPPGSVEARAVVAPGDRVGEYDLPPGGQRVGYGSEPPDPAATYFEKAMWSENPTFPPPQVDPGDPLLATDEETYAHEDLLAAATDVVETHGIEPGDRVAVRASLLEPGTVVAGLLAPVLAGGEVVLARGVERSVGDLAVASGGAPEPGVVAPGEAAPGSRA